MTITREQVADLRAGDVVSLLDTRWPPGTACVGPLWHDEDTGALRCGTAAIRYADGGVPWTAEHRSLTVISRAPRPLYVNHDRTEPVRGDVVRDADSDKPQVWIYGPVGLGVGRQSNPWKRCDPASTHDERSSLPDRLRLLVDGATGETVPKFRSQGQVVQ